jgi:hypothetical protein
MEGRNQGAKRKHEEENGRDTWPDLMFADEVT